mmetsp:Transcript_30641/g.103283  ORF Transcript_30641/g.103283 Transcript_30641/m.103283 type:complete len:228 (-) Transcript_30641:360-1043(-)
MKFNLSSPSANSVWWQGPAEFRTIKVSDTLPVCTGLTCKSTVGAFDPSPYFNAFETTLSSIIVTSRGSRRSLWCADCGSGRTSTLLPANRSLANLFETKAATSMASASCGSYTPVANKSKADFLMVVSRTSTASEFSISNLFRTFSGKGSFGAEATAQRSAKTMSRFLSSWLMYLSVRSSSSRRSSAFFSAAALCEEASSLLNLGSKPRKTQMRSGASLETGETQTW